MSEKKPDKERGAFASSSEFARYDQVDKPDYHLNEAADAPEDFDEDFSFTTVDLERYLRGDEGDQRAFAEELGTAMQDIGFVILEGHGVDTQLFGDAATWTAALFCEPSLEEKMRYRAQRHEAVSEGYFPIEETSDIHPDQVEGWVFGRRAFDLDGAPGFEASEFWPRAELLPKFRKLVEAELPLFRPLLHSMLRYLGSDPHRFDAELERPLLGQRLNYYPPLVGHVGPGETAGRLLGHEDIDLFTLLPAPSVEGLQVLHRNGKWVRLDAPLGSIILNTGDYLQRLSNDILPSTTHRVSRPRDPELAKRSRVSFPLAAYLPAAHILEVLPELSAPKYEPISVLTFHTRTTAKFYGDDYAVETPPNE